MKTAEQILRLHFPPPRNEGEKNDDINIIKVMEEYANQYKPVAVSDELFPNDEWIKEMYPTDNTVDERTRAYNDQAKVAMMEMRSEIKQRFEKLTTPSKQVAVSDEVEFARWIFTETIDSYNPIDKYAEKTTQQLYDLFTQSKNK